MKLKFLLALVVVIFFSCSACVVYINPSTPAASDSTNASSSDASSSSLPDLVPLAIEYDQSLFSIGNAIQFDSSVQNAGNANANQFNIKWLVNNVQEGYGAHSGVLAGSTDRNGNSQFTWTPQQAGTYQIEFVVDCDDFILESNERNNSVSVMVTITDNNNAAQHDDTPQSTGPEITGLILKNGIYYYAENGGYGEEPGTVAGYVVPEVYVNGKLTGGVCLKPNVCLAILQIENAQIPDGQVKLKVIVPLDIAGFDGKVEIGEMSLYPSGGSSAHHVLSVSCAGNVNVLSTISAGTLVAWSLNTESGEVLRSVANVDAYDNFNRDLAFRNIIISSTGTEFLEYRQGVTTEYPALDYGDVISRKERDSVIYLDFVTTELPCVLTADDLLTIDGYVVFINEY